jgi:hypothetical protein
MAGDACRSYQDCRVGGSSVLTCAAPGQFLGCGACQQPPATCSVDGDCRTDGGNMICDVAPAQRCYCFNAKICQAGCAASGCATGQICDADGRCKAKTCTPGDQSCPTDFDCSAAGACARRSCTTDTPCSAACVNGACYGALGTCQLVPV